MRSSTGRWVSGDDFFDREAELALLESRVRDRNHVLLTGQRRMGKTSIARELGLRLESQGWVFLFTDIEDATCPEDVIADIAQVVHPIQPVASRFAETMKRWVSGRVEEVSALEFRVKIRAGLDAGSWRRYGEQLMRTCAEYEKPVLLVIDELPIFLKSLLRAENGAQKVDEFLRWLRHVLQELGDGTLAVIVSGSIGLRPLVERIGLPDRINHLDPFRLGPWTREASIECFTRLADTYALPVEDDVADAVYDALGIGIPHHVQSFFARLRDFAVMQKRTLITRDDVGTVYRNALLGPAGQNDLVHYEARLREGLDGDSYTVAMEILAEAATRDVFTGDARWRLETLYSPLIQDVRARINEALDVLVHDGYLETGEDGHRFPSRLLKDWWSARFRDHHTPLLERVPDHEA